MNLKAKSNQYKKKIKKREKEREKRNNEKPRRAKMERTAER